MSGPGRDQSRPGFCFVAARGAECPCRSFRRRLCQSPGFSRKFSRGFSRGHARGSAGASVRVPASAARGALLPPRDALGLWHKTCSYESESNQDGGV
jgi:hypothetical protein